MKRQGLLEMRMDMDKEKKRIELYENKNQIVNAAIDRIVVELFHKKEEKEKGQAVLLTGCSPLAGTTSTCIGWQLPWRIPSGKPCWWTVM